MFDFKKIIAEKISNCTNIEIEEIKEYIEVPPDKKMGDYAFPCFRLAKSLKKAPPVIAEEIKENINIDSNLISKIEVQGGYLNFFVNNEALVKSVLGEINNLKENYGSSYIGHLRNTIIGNCLYKVYKFLGYNVIRNKSSWRLWNSIWKIN